ncbi:type II toxin-antitoxin system RelE/ParE family toxin [bacterium]|nr:MAG: type II toxin-antitoxin system RelE/ParE family toxin [bacterium]
MRLTRAARRDIVDALQTSRNEFGERKATEYDQLVQLSLREIAMNPTGVRSRPREDLAPAARTMHIARHGRNARHLFVYVIEPNGTVRVLRLLYDSMDLKRHLTGEQPPEPREDRSDIR